MSRARSGYGSNRGSLNPIQITKYIKKVADQYVNNSTAFVNDTELKITFPNRASVYDIELIAFASGDNAANIKSTWVVGGGTTQITYRNCIGATAASSFAVYDTQMQNRADNLNAVIDYGTDGTYITCIREKFIVSTTSSLSTLQWKWAQNSAVASNTTVYAFSYILAQEIRLFS